MEIPADVIGLPAHGLPSADGRGKEIVILMILAAMKGRLCEEYAQKNNILILDTYIDRAMTGTNDNRPDFQRMLKDSSRKEWNFVLVYKLDRFSRNKYETAIHKKALRDNGVKVLSAMENIPDTPEGIILESLLEG